MVHRLRRCRQRRLEGHLHGGLARERANRGLPGRRRTPVESDLHERRTRRLHGRDGGVRACRGSRHSPGLRRRGLRWRRARGHRRARGGWSGRALEERERAGAALAERAAHRVAEQQRRNRRPRRRRQPGANDDHGRGVCLVVARGPALRAWRRGAGGSGPGRLAVRGGRRSRSRQGESDDGNRRTALVRVVRGPRPRPSLIRGDPWPMLRETMTSFVKTRLAAMMFLNYIIWGSWYVTMNTYLTTTLHFSGTEAGAVFGTTAVASMVSPFFVGLVADRFFATERVLAALYALSAVFLVLVTQVTSFGAVYALMLIFCLCYFPTIALTNSITMQNVPDPGRDFPGIRVLGTFGWIFINLIVGFMRVEAKATPFLLGAIAAVVMCVYSLLVLPHTPPAGRGQQMTVRRILGLDALAMMKD